MADIIRIKRRSSGAPGAPSSLANAELAYNEIDHTLYYGEGGTSTAAATITAIGGQGLASNMAPLMNSAAAPGAATVWSRGDHVHPTDTSRAPLISPAFTGVPTAPTAPPGANNTQIATTAFVTAAISAVPAGVTKITAGTAVAIAPPGGLGNVTVGVATNGIDNTLLTQMPAGSIKGNNAGTTANAMDLTTAQVMAMLGAAPLASPAFTGTPTAPTPTAGDATTKIATTAFVSAAIAAVPAGVTSIVAGTAIAITPPTGLGAVTVAVAANSITNVLAAQMPANTLKGNNTASTANQGDLTVAQVMAMLQAAPLNSPGFTGTPIAPTPAPGTSTTQIATTAFVAAAIGATPIVSSVTVGAGLTGGGTGAVTVAVGPNAIDNTLIAHMPAMSLKGNNTGAAANAADLTTSQVMTMLAAAPLASPAFTGTPTAPTAANGTNTTQLATTAYVLLTRIDQLQAPIVDVSWNSQHIIGLANPVNAQDAATKNYVDQTVQGMSPKPSATVATLAALPANTYANGTAGFGATLTATANAALTVDGHPVNAGERVLVKNEATAANNGLYMVTAPGSSTTPYVLTRDTAMDTSGEFAGGFIAVENIGVANANTLWLANPTLPVTVGTTPIPFTQLNGATSLIAGNGIAISANTISAVGVPGKISVGAPGITIDSTYVGQTSISTLGTVTTGIWSGTTVGVAYGGTGVATLAAGYVRGNGTAAFTSVSTIPNTDITGLGSMSTQNANAVAITGGTIDGVVIDGGVF